MCISGSSEFQRQPTCASVIDNILSTLEDKVRESYSGEKRSKGRDDRYRAASGIVCP